MARPRLRHWKQRFDPNADLIVSKRMLLNGKQMESGDVLSEDQKQLIGKHRLRLWWEGGRLQLDSGSSYEEAELIGSMQEQPDDGES